MKKKDEIELLESNLKEGRQRFRNGEVSREQWDAMKKDANNRIKEIKKSRDHGKSA